jgi:hypothetical protein
MVNKSSAATPRVTTGTMMFRFDIFFPLPHDFGLAM